MDNNEFIRNFNPSKLIDINSVMIINDVEKRDIYYKTKLQGDIKIKIKYLEWSFDDYLFQINEIGMMYSEVFIHCSDISNFSCLDEFLYYTRLIQNDGIKNIQRFPFKKEQALSKSKFIDNYNLYFNEIFLGNEDKLIDIDFEDFKDGYFYFNEPSVIVMGCQLENQLWGFTYIPYI